MENKKNCFSCMHIMNRCNYDRRAEGMGCDIGIISGKLDITSGIECGFWDKEGSFLHNQVTVDSGNDIKIEIEGNDNTLDSGGLNAKDLVDLDIDKIIVKGSNLKLKFIKNENNKLELTIDNKD